MQAKKPVAELSNILRDWYECEYHGTPGQVGPSGSLHGNGGEIDGADLSRTNQNLVNSAFTRLSNSFLIPFIERSEAEESMLQFCWSLPRRRNTDERERKADAVYSLKRHIVHVCDGRGGGFGQGLPDVLNRAWASFAGDLMDHAAESYRSVGMAV